MKPVSYLCLFAVSTAVLGTLGAQQVPLQRPEEKYETQRQSQELFDAVRPVAREASASTVWVWMNGHQVALGTVVGGGDKVLTKWSEIALSRTPIQCVGGDGATATATVLGVYEDEDLALLQLDKGGFQAVSWSQKPAPVLGQFLVAAAPDDNPVRIGVVAVEERVLKESDQAFIGVEIDREYSGEGIKVRSVDDRGGADEAGIRSGDLMLSVSGKPVSSGFELRGVLQEHKPGDRVGILLKRDQNVIEVEVVLGGRPEFPGFPEARLRGMRQMGGPISVVGSGFPVVIQTDMQLRPKHCGGPVVDLDGDVVGISIARTDRTRSFILPGREVASLLNEAPVSPELAKVRQSAGDGVPRKVPRGRAMPMDPRAAGRLRQHLEEMQKLLERMESEMSEIGEGADR